MEQLPANLDAERFVLGAILLNDGLYVQAAGSLNPDDFSIEKHRRIFSRIGNLHSRGDRIDRVTVANELIRHGELESCDGLSYLVSLDDGIPQNLNIDAYIHIVKDKAMLRRIVFASQHVMNRAMLGQDEPYTILASAEEKLLRLSEQGRTAVCWAASDLLQAALERAAQHRRQFEEAGKPVMGIQSGIRKLDDILSGFNPGLHLLAGGPGVGKTTLAMQITREACQRGVPAVYVTYENSARNLILKAICARAGINPRHIERGDAHVHDQEKFRVAASELVLPFSRLAIIEGSMSLTVAEIRATVAKVLRHHNATTCLVVVDYLQRAARAQGYNELRINVSYLSGHLRDLANRVDCPVLCLASQNRAEGNYGNGRGSAALTSLKESGDLEFDADSAMFLHPGERMAVPPARAVDLTISKQRDGDVASVPLVFRPDLGTFREEAYSRAAK